MDFLTSLAPLRPVSLCLCWALPTALLISRVSGNICNVPWNAHLQNYTVVVSSQADLDTAFSGCTTINGNIWINETYTGGFNLSEVVSMNGTIEADNYAGFTFMEFDNLITFSGLFYIQTAFHLKNISMASAVFMSYMQLESFVGETNLDFPELVNVTTFEIWGQFGSINFPKLAYIESGMLVGSAEYSYIDPDETYNSVGAYPPMEINFPSLTYSACVLIWGNISSINMPLLETANGVQLIEEFSKVGGPEGLYIATYGIPLDVNLPRLSNTSTVALLGTIGNFSFPSLLNVDEINIYSYYDLNVDLFPIQSVTNISLTGNITAFNGSSLKAIAQSLYIQTNVPNFDCTTTQQIWNQTSHNSSFDTGVGFPAGISSDDSYGVYCGLAPPPPPDISMYPKKQLSLSAIAGISVGSSILVTCLCICLVYRMCHRRERSKPPQLYSAYPAYGVELQDRRPSLADGEVLPQYEPAVQGEELASPVSAVNAGNARPPRYEDALIEGESVSGGRAEGEAEDVGLLGRW